jgi:hypothetical protein
VTNVVVCCRLREMREQSDKDHQEELDLYVKTNQDLKTQMEGMHLELAAKQVCVWKLTKYNTRMYSQICLRWSP